MSATVRGRIRHVRRGVAREDDMPSWPGFGPVRKVYAVDGSGAEEPEYWEDQWDAVDVPAVVERQQRERPEMLREFAARIPRGGRVLEAGCGSGVKLAHLAGDGFDVYGVDFAVGALANLVRQVHSVRAAGGDLAALPFADGSFECVLSLGTLEHFEDGPQRALAEHRRILREGGTLVIVMPRISGLKQWKDWWAIGVARRDAYLSGRGRLVRRLPEPAREDDPVGAFVQYEFSRRWFLRYLRDAGFTPVSVHASGNKAGIGESRLVQRLAAKGTAAKAQAAAARRARPEPAPVAPAARTNGRATRPRRGSLPKRIADGAKAVAIGEQASARWQEPLVRLFQSGLAHADLVVATAGRSS
jgi:SAM-dependent methyltransferase